MNHLGYIVDDVPVAAQAEVVALNLIEVGPAFDFRLQGFHLSPGFLKGFQMALRGLLPFFRGEVGKEKN